VLLWLAGKAFTYVFLGAVIGLAGQALLASPALAGSRRWVALGLGALMVAFGVLMLLRRVPAIGGQNGGASLWGSVLSSFLRTPGPGTSALLGLFAGLLPCPATVAALLAAAGTGAALSAMALMLGFAGGSAPALLAIGLGSGALAPRLRNYGAQVAACIVVLMGLATAVRGSVLLEQVCPSCRSHGATPAVATEESCPACRAMDGPGSK
jgi:hypothetical protein